MKQTTFASLAWDGKKRVTRRERFLGEMDGVIPWTRIIGLIEPHYPKGESGRPPNPLAVMLRIYFMQQWFNLSDPQAEDGLYDSESMRRFAGLELADDALPDETTICKFRHLLERHQLTGAIFEEVRGLLEERRPLLKSGTIVDATLIAAPPSTKNQDRARDPEMRQTRKGKQWHFGMKLHVGTDLQGLVHTLTATHAAVPDVNPMPELLHGQEKVVYGDRAYWRQQDRALLEDLGVRYRVNRRGTRKNPLPEQWRLINRARSRIRARGEHALRVVKQLWGFTKVRYRGLAKNLARAYTMFALANLYLMRRQLAQAGQVPAQLGIPGSQRATPIKNRPSNSLRPTSVSCSTANSVANHSFPRERAKAEGAGLGRRRADLDADSYFSRHGIRSALYVFW